MLNEGKKPWWASVTVWSGIATVGGAATSAAYAYFGLHDSGAAIAALQLAWPGIAAIYGRVTATQKIGSA